MCSHVGKANVRKQYLYAPLGLMAAYTGALLTYAKAFGAGMSQRWFRASMFMCLKAGLDLASGSP